MSRSLFAAALVLAGSACQPDIPFTPPSTVVTAVFDPTEGEIPLPNDLARPPFSNPNSTCPPPANALPPGSPPGCAQAELLTSFAAGFPSDQEVAITIDFTQTEFTGGKTVQVAPELDFASINASTFGVVMLTAPGGAVELDPITAADYVKRDEHGTLTLHNKGRQPWAPGSYAVVMRGGDSGVKTTAGTAVSPSPVFAIIAQACPGALTDPCLDMTDPANIGLLRAQAGSKEAAIEQGRGLNLLIGLYKQTAFPVADQRFPHQELAIAATFTVAPRVTNVTVDSARGLVPLPIDLLRDPTSGKLSALAACSLAGSKLAADGTCPSPAAAGFRSLDGFSTTGAILAPTSDLIQASTATSASVKLFNLADPANPVEVPAANLIIEPCEFTQGCGVANALSTVIAIQPAGATAGDPTSVFRTKPLKDNTDYAVVMTTAINDKAGNPIGPGTVAKIVRFKNPITVNGKSALRGIDDTTAASLEKMRTQLQPVFTKLAAGGIDASKVAMAYTFKTQTITSQAVQLAALPYTTPAATAAPGAVTALTPAAAFTKYGVDATVVPSGNIDQILEVDITTFNALDPATGAFLADPTKAAPETIHVLIATPKAANANVPACTGALAAFGKCAPLMVYRHQLGKGRADLLTVADTNAAAGMVTVAIDAAKAGDRSFCTSGTTGALSGCVGGAACTTTLPAGAQGDEHPPGTCGAAGFFKRPVSATCTGTCATNATDGIAAVSGNYVVSANLFRTRDTMRQDLIDQSQLVRAMAFVPSKAPPTGHTVFDHMFARGLATSADNKGLIIDPAFIYYSGQSFGAIQGAMNVAANPRISKAVFNVGGGTMVDLFVTSPAFQAQVDALLASLGIQRGTAAFLQFLTVAKTVLDPADPINFVGHITANTLPNLLPPLGGNPDGSVPQAPKKALVQMANCDANVPNPFSLLFASNLGVAPLPTGADFFNPTIGGGVGTFQIMISTQPPFTTFGTCPASAVPHDFLTSWAIPSLAQNAQTDLANFVTKDVAPLRVQHP